MSDLPVSEMYKLIGTYTDCNDSEEFNFDENITAVFHDKFYSKHSCIFPFWDGNVYAEETNHTLCAGDKYDLYNDTWANAEFRETIDSMPIKPCTMTKVGFGPVHTTKMETGNAQLTIKLPRQLEL